MKNNEAYEILDNYQFQDWNCLTDEYKQKLDDMKQTCLKALRKKCIKGYCKDCKHCELDIPFVFAEKDEVVKRSVCRLIGYIVNKNDYCSRWEAKS